jgi:hypothetical protein
VAVFGHWGVKDPLPVLHFGHDLVAADTWIDDGRSARALSEAMLAQGRAMFVIVWGMPPRILDELVAGRRVRPLQGRVALLEVREGAPPQSAATGP